MKFAATIPLLAFALGAVADPTINERATLVERDLATITGVLSTISQQVGSLDTTVKGFSGDVAGLQSASDSVLSAINDGTQKVSGTSEITVTDALTVQTAVGTLTTAVQGVVADLNSQKSKIVAAGAGGQVLSALQKQKAASQSLADAITSKVPSALRELADTLSAGIASALQEGIDNFKDAANSGPASSAAAPASSAAAPASSKASSAASAPSSAAAVAPSSAPAAKPTSTMAGGMAGMSHASASASAPAQFTGAANINALSGSVGAIAAVAAVLIM